MAIREIIILPDRQLRLVSKPVDKVTPEVRKLADDMFETHVCRARHRAPLRYRLRSRCG